jgi:6-phosphogluconolactonase
MNVYVGTFSTADQPSGIAVYTLDQATGALTHVQSLGGLNSPSFIALHPSRPVLVAVERQWTADDGSQGAVSSFAVDERDGTLRPVSRVSSRGVSPCYVSIHPSGSHAFAAHYVSGHVAAFPLGPQGTLGEASGVVQHAGKGPDPRRQEGPHAHSVIPDPAGRYVLSCDLGVDKVFVYRFSPDGPAAGQLIPNEVPYGQVQSGAGPRHIAFHPTAPYVYVINEIGNTICAFAYDPGRGTLTHVQTIATLPEDFATPSHTAQIIVHPSGRFLYGSNRGHDSLAVFAIDQASGKLTARGHTSSLGKTPRNFNVDPTGTYLLAANQASDTIVTFRIDPDTGALSPAGHVTDLAKPSCIVFR